MGLEDTVVEIIKWIRESVRPVVVIVIVSALALFLPQAWLSKVGVLDWLQKYRPLVVLSFAGSLIWLGTFPIERLYSVFQKTRRLGRLAPDQQEALRPYILNNKTTHGFDRWKQGAVTVDLARFGLLVDTGVRNGEHPYYSIDLWTFRHLRKHPELVGITKNPN